MREGRRGGSQTARSSVVTGCIVILGQKQVTPRWADDPVRRHVGGGVVREGGGFPQRKEIRKHEEREGRVRKTSM